MDKKNANGLKNGFTIKEVKLVMDYYNKLGWTNEFEKGKTNTQTLKDFSSNVERLRANAAQSKKTTKSKKKKK